MKKIILSLLFPRHCASVDTRNASTVNKARPKWLPPTDCFNSLVSGAARILRAGRVIVAVVGATLAFTAAPVMASTLSAGDEFIAADGETLAIAALNPPSRLAGMVAVYTPAFGTSTNTNPWGGEAVLVADGTPGGYTVERVCTALAACADAAWQAGDNTIPENGVVLSVSPGGSPDVRAFVRDHVRAGDTVRIAPVVSRSASTIIDAVDPTALSHPGGVDGSGVCYPGCRGAEQIIKYTPASARPKTGTNDFGFEVTVQDGIVTGAGGNNRDIPANGFVISGHGSRGTWLQTNAVVGATISIDEFTLTATVDERTAIYGAEQTLADADARIAVATESCQAFPEALASAASADAASSLDDARSLAESGDKAGAVELALAARASAELAAYRTAESRPAEGRVTWVRPEETTPAEIEETLDRIHGAGFNMVFLETIYQGYTIYPSAAAAAAGVVSQRPNMVGFDPLQVWIDGAHARGIELHPWVHTFFVGSEQRGGVGPVLSVHPEWSAVQRKDVGGPLAPSVAEPGYYFLDAAHPGARAYVQSLLEELMTQYDIDGVHLDYIRYPVSLPWETAGYSYSDYSRQAFETLHGVDPYTLTPAEDTWQTWTDWRISNVTSFVGEVRELQQRVAPESALSAAVFADPVDGLDKKFQNWGDWVDRGYVDLLTGMSFGTSGVSVARDTKAMRARVGDNQYLYTATYGPFRGSSPATMLEQIRAVGDAGSDGVGLFAWNQLSDGQGQALAEGPHRTEAVAPHADPVGAARIGIRALREQLRDSARSCVDIQTGVRGSVHLKLAEAWLAAGRLDKAARALERAAAVFGDAEEPDSESFVARAARDIAMYGRWVDTAIERQY